MAAVHTEESSLYTSEPQMVEEPHPGGQVTCAEVPGEPPIVCADCSQVRFTCPKAVADQSVTRVKTIKYLFMLLSYKLDIFTANKIYES
jgi:hypothetical protein